MRESLGKEFDAIMGVLARAFPQCTRAEGYHVAKSIMAAVASSSPPQRIERPSEDQARMNSNLESGDPR